MGATAAASSVTGALVMEGSAAAVVAVGGAFTGVTLGLTVGEAVMVAVAVGSGKSLEPPKDWGMSW